MIFLTYVLHPPSRAPPVKCLTQAQFIALRMREADVWKNASDVEFDNALESMEKLVMNRLYEL